MVSSVIQGSVSGRNNVGILQLLKGAKFAIKEWTGCHSNLPRKAMSMLEREIQDLELVQNQGNEDLSIARKIVVLVNGVPIDRFPIVKGMRQGFSFSSMLFNIVGEALNQLVTKAVEAGLFSGFLIGKRVGQTRVSHLQFVDDLMILCDASLEQAKSVGCEVGHFSVEYLGLPLKLKRNSLALWDPIVDKLNAQLASWKLNTLSLVVMATEDYSEEISIRFEVSSLQLSTYWSFSSVFLKDPGSFLLAWHGVDNSKAKDSIWHIIPFGIIWIVWLYRNDIIFNKSHLDVVQLFFLVRYRAVMWFKARLPELECSADSRISDLSLESKLLMCKKKL
ncbi:hypothetical protein V6N11_059537 [Hibiscus sabdariffa]|uniref:Reverse transcriptase domain-containing protein n=1 Tax=Hibiscus sabdariffa TaxID=183260 RepID=A0ABR2NP03_9ROSI